MASRLSTLVALAEADGKDPLDDYVGAHAHGTVDLTRDAAALVPDPCYPGTPTEKAARRLPARSNGTAASPWPRPSYAATLATGAKSSRTSAYQTPATDKVRY